jgi:hypothetical protein
MEKMLKSNKNERLPQPLQLEVAFSVASVLSVVNQKQFTTEGTEITEKRRRKTIARQFTKGSLSLLGQIKGFSLWPLCSLW